ncbi:MAG: carbon-nitrogen hydrolase family protein, partial [Solirubrobacteraceae bacterium]
MSKELVRLAAAQATPVFMDRDATVQKAVALVAEAGRAGAQLIAFPETWIPGYPMWIYGAAGWDDPRTKRAFAHLCANAVEVPGSATDALCRAARKAGVIVVMGIHERDAIFSTGTLYNSLLFISAEGEIMGVRRKLMPTHAERLLWGQGDGSALAVYDTPIGRLGGAICWEHWMPLGRFAMHAKGEQIHVAAWPELPDIHHLASRHYAFEGRCFVVCVGSYMRVSDIPEDFELRDVVAAGGQFADDGDELLPGGSGIIGPDSRWIAGPVAGREEIVYGDVDLDAIAGEQLAFDAAGHYN